MAALLFLFSLFAPAQAEPPSGFSLSNLLMSTTTIPAKNCLAKIFSAENLHLADTNSYESDPVKLNIGDPECEKHVKIKVDGHTYVASYFGKGVKLNMNEKKEFYSGDAPPPGSATPAKEQKSP